MLPKSNMNLPTSYIYLWLLTALSFPPCSLGFVIYAFNFCRLNRKTLRFIGGHGKRFQFVVFLHTRQYLCAEICVSFSVVPNRTSKYEYVYLHFCKLRVCLGVYYVELSVPIYLTPLLNLRKASFIMLLLGALFVIFWTAITLFWFVYFLGRTGTAAAESEPHPWGFWQCQDGQEWQLFEVWQVYPDQLWRQRLHCWGQHW